MDSTISILEEQKKIGNFFKQLDDTIALQQRKLDLLKETKKDSYKMFLKRSKSARNSVSWIYGRLGTA